MDNNNKDENIIMFPKSKAESPPQSLDEIRATVEQGRLEHVDTICELIVDDIFGRLAIEGFDVGEHLNDAIFIYEAVKSSMLRRYQINHHLQKISDELYTEYYEDGGNNNSPNDGEKLNRAND